MRSLGFFYFPDISSPAILASSGSITGISSRTGYTRRQETHFNPEPSLKSSTRVLQTGQTKMSRAYFGIARPLSVRNSSIQLRELALYQTPSHSGNPAWP